MSDFEPGKPISLTSLVTRVVAPNSGMMTGPGTNTYLIGNEEIAVVDPGPTTPEHIDAIIAAANGKKISRIFVTHTHSDHSPGAQPLAEATGAEIIGWSAPQGFAQDKSFSPGYSPKHGELFVSEEFTVEIIHTPGHASNHLCFLLREEQLLFTGDHIMEGSTVVIMPPDGDMADYLDSLTMLKSYPIAQFAPGHGNLVDEPFALVDATVAHRLKREAKIVAAMEKAAQATVKELVKIAYDDTPEYLHKLAEHSLLAHLLKLEKENRAERSEERWSYTG